MKAIKTIDFYHPKNEDGTDFKYSVLVTLSLPLHHSFGILEDSKKKDSVAYKLAHVINEIKGIDAVDLNVGNYSFKLMIARTFAPDEVLDALKEGIERDVLSSIVRPTLTLPH